MKMRDEDEDIDVLLIICNTIWPREDKKQQ